MEPKRCKDCLDAGVTTIRPAPHPGPRCYTHHKAFGRRQRAARHEKRVQKVYGLAPGGYDALRALQGGQCAICGPRAKGKSRSLSVDHDHKTGRVRGLLCNPCNKLLGHARDDPAFFVVAARYLVDPPASRLDSKFLQEDEAA